MNRLGDRAGTERRYRDLRRKAFLEAQGVLGSAGIFADLRNLDAAALAALAAWQNRRVAWPWHDMAADFRRNHTGRFELAVWHEGVLCGLALGKPSSSPSHLALHYVEGNPDPTHPLQGTIMAVVLTAANTYAVVLGKAELRLMDPLPALIPYYCGPALGFELVTLKGQVPYCRRST